jgi:hypothetical protein
MLGRKKRPQRPADSPHHQLIDWPHVLNAVEAAVDAFGENQQASQGRRKSKRMAFRIRRNAPRASPARQRGMKNWIEHRERRADRE